MNQETMIPIGQQVLGRVLNSKGEPIDGQGPIPTPQRSSLYSLPSTGQQAQTMPQQMFETGIKAVDLLTPLPHGGTIAFFAGMGAGKLVLVEELMHRIITHDGGYAVCISMDESTYESSELIQVIKEDIEAKNKTVLIFEQATNEVYQRIVEVGLTIAGQFRDEGHEALLVADKYLTTKGNLISMRELRRAAWEKGIPTILLGPEYEYGQLAQQHLLSDLDGHLLFRRDLAIQGIYPAIDRLVSGSRLLQNGGVSTEHMQVATQVRQVLRRYYDLQNVLANQSTNGLSDEDTQVVKRASRIQQFLTQPFFVAEPYTDRPGEYVSISETIQGFKELLEGRYDDVPEQAFSYVGTIEQALAKSQALIG